MPVIKIDLRHSDFDLYTNYFKSRDVSLKEHTTDVYVVNKQVNY